MLLSSTSSIIVPHIKSTGLPTMPDRGIRQAKLSLKLVTSKYASKQLTTQLTHLWINWQCNPLAAASGYILFEKNFPYTVMRQAGIFHDR